MRFCIHLRWSTVGISFLATSGCPPTKRTHCGLSAHARPHCAVPVLYTILVSSTATSSWKSAPDQHCGPEKTSQGTCAAVEKTSFSQRPVVHTNVVVRRLYLVQYPPHKKGALPLGAESGKVPGTPSGPSSILRSVRGTSDALRDELRCRQGS